MLNKPILGAIGTCSLLLLSQGALAAPVYNQSVTSNVIFGSGNINGSFTTDTQNNVELGLRGKLRHNGSGAAENTFNSNGDGTYSFDAGVAPTQSSPTAVWSFEWSINVNQDGGTSGRTLGDLTYVLGMDTDPGIGATYTTFDPINDANPGTSGWWDHSMGDNSTANGAGVEATDDASYAANLALYSLAQNSWKAHWFLSPFDPTVDGQYEFYLKTFDGATELASTNMSIIVGAGVVPIPAAAWLFGSALGLLGWVRRRTNLPRT